MASISIRLSKELVAKRISVVAVADHPIMQRGIASLLADEEDMDLVAQVSTGNEAVEAIKALQPDVAVLNFKLPGINALEVLEELGDIASATRTVIIASRLSEKEFLHAIRLGTRGILLKDMPAQMLARCIRSVHQGQEFVEREMLLKAFGKLLRGADSEKELAVRLTSREMAVVRLVVDGLSNKQVARKLAISEGTVKVHLHRTYEKLGVQGRMKLLLFAHERGLV